MASALQIQGPNQQTFEEIEECFTLMEQAQNLGSIMKFNISDTTREFIIKCIEEQNRQHKFEKEFADIFHGFHIILALTEKYAALAMNPPYLGAGHIKGNLFFYIKENYVLTSNDLGAVFMDVTYNLLKSNGKYGMINQAAWLLKPAYKEYRDNIIKCKYYNLDNLLYLGPNTFPELKGEVVQSATFVVSKSIKIKTAFYYLTKGGSSDEKRDLYLSGLCRRYVEDIIEFSQYSGSQFGFWISQIVQKTFKDSPIQNYGDAKQGLKTGDNPRFIRTWYEVSKNKIEKKWYPVETGGNFRKWYGNAITVLNWENDGFEIKNFKTEEGKLRSRPQGLQFSFQKGITWSTSAGSKPSFRYSDERFLFESSGSKFFLNNKGQDDELTRFCAYFNSFVVRYFIEMLSPGIGVSEGAIKSLPYINSLNDCSALSTQCINISKQDWDAHETSWDYEENEIVSYVNESRDQGLECTFVDKERKFGSYSSDAKPSFELKDLYQEYITKWTENFAELHNNEEELNRQFIEIYGLQDELNPDVPLDEITILQQGEISIEDNQIKWHADVVMKQLISYAIGCMMGRYRLDKKGLCIAHPNPSEEEYAPYEYHGSTFSIDDDGIIPLMAKDSRFDDNCVNRFTDFIKLVFGVETLTDNMNFLEEALGKSVEQYLIKDFWKDHKKMYQNRPIYWLFSSKKGAFQVIAYMHRMNKYTAENIRNKYLLPHIDYLRQELAGLDARITALSPQERKLYQKLQKDLEECMEYHDRLHSVADQQIDFDLDDGVVVNYAKFGDVLAKLK